MTEYDILTDLHVEGSLNVVGYECGHDADPDHQLAAYTAGEKALTESPRKRSRRTRRRDHAGPFTGKHERTALMIAPPEWNLSPTEYRNLARLDMASKGPAVGSLTVAAAGAAGFWGAGAVPGSFESGNMAVAAIGTIAGTVSALGLGCASFTVPQYLSRRNHDPNILGHRNPAEAISPIGFPTELFHLLLAIADVSDLDFDGPGFTVRRHERLELAYTSAQQFIGAYHADTSLNRLFERYPEQVSGLLKFAAQDGLPQHIATAAFSVERRWNTYLHGQANILSSTSVPSTPSPTPRAPVEPRTPPASLPLRTQWVKAIEAHDRVVDAWTNIICDPLEALDHSLLLDVTQPRTATFIEAYGHAQDLRAVYGTTFPTGPHDDAHRVARDYLSAVRKADAAWADAVRHAGHVNLRWLPEAEATNVRRASALLAVAADESATIHERATAAKKAAALLAEVTSFVLPAEAMRALDTTRRLAITAGDDTQ